MTDAAAELATPPSGASIPPLPQKPISFVRVALLWTLLIGALAGWNYYRDYQSNLASARLAAAHSFAKDLTFRRWATEHGGVYVTTTERTPPNPYLSQIPERDLTTPSGRSLTLVNPAYMVRQIYEMADGTFGTKGHITSLDPIRPENAPDSWESAVLKAFEEGEPEISSLEEFEGETYLRLMRPLRTEAGCLKCHADQGYELGSIRGGISVSIPWAPYRADLRAAIPLYLFGYGGLWTLGLVGIGVTRRRLNSYLAARCQAEEALRLSDARYRSLFFNQHSVMLLVDPADSRIVDANPAACAYYGYPYEALRGMNISEINIMAPEELLAEMERAKALDSNEFEFRHRLANGEIRDVKVLTGPVRFNDCTYLYSIIHDITERKLAEAALHQAGEELLRRGAELERFTYTVSHDLKSPLVTIQAFLGFLEQDLAQQDGERVAKDIDFMRTAAGKMSRLLDELLEMTRVGRLVNAPEEVSFHTLVDEVLSLCAGAITQKAVEVQVEAQDLTLFGDRPRLVEIWQNLVENAVKYLGDQLQGCIEIGFVKDCSGVTFHVRDNGIGLEPCYADKIFHLFEQLDKASEGSGLGLALVKRIVGLYGGRIWVESPGLGQGASFYFTLPDAMKKGAADA